MDKDLTSGDKTTAARGYSLLVGCCRTSPLLLTERTKTSLLDDLIDIEWECHPKYGQSYLTYDNQVKYDEIISTGRRLGVFDTREVALFRSILTSGARHLRELKEHLRNQPRRDAQKFIGKKNVREWLFKRDGCCLRCGDTKMLSVDHIVSVNRGGENKLSNLQTLCRSCNSWKSDSYIDFR
jgi:hypothetical protein